MQDAEEVQVREHSRELAESFVNGNIGAVCEELTCEAQKGQLHLIVGVALELLSMSGVQVVEVLYRALAGRAP